MEGEERKEGRGAIFGVDPGSDSAMMYLLSYSA